MVLWPRVVLLLLAGALTYAGSFSHPFIFDDTISIVTNPTLGDLSHPVDILWPSRELPTAGRPLPSLSFALNYAVGGLDVRGYHVVNLALHLVCALLVLLIVWRTLERPSLSTTIRDLAPDIAFASALLWVVHPLNSEVVNYLTQRTESMMAACFLLTLYASLRAAEPHTPGWHGLAVFACACGMLCKESMVTAPLIVPLYDTVFLFGSWRAAFRARWRLHLALASTWLLLAWLLSAGPRSNSAGFSAGVSPWTYLLNQAGMIVRYLWLVVWPRGLVLMYGPPQPTALTAVLPAALIVTALLGLTVWALKRRPLFGFVGAWVFLTLATTSSVIPIATEVGAERRMYLPLVALIAAVVATIGGRLVSRRHAWIGLSVVAALLITGTIVRTREYESALTMAQTVVERRPTGVAHWVVGTELIRAGRPDAGVGHLREATRLGESQAFYDIGARSFKAGQFDMAVPALQQYVGAHPSLLDAIPARVMLAQAAARLNRWSDAVEQATLVLTMDSQNVEAVGVLAAAAIRDERYADAILRWRQYLAARPDDVAALSSLGIALAATDQASAAIATLQRAVALDSANAAAHLQLAILLFQARDANAASAHAIRAVTLDPGNPVAHDILGRALAVQGQGEAAVLQFQQAIQLDPSYAEARESLARLLQARPDLRRAVR